MLVLLIIEDIHRLDLILKRTTIKNEFNEYYIYSHILLKWLFYRKLIQTMDYFIQLLIISLSPRHNSALFSSTLVGPIQVP